MATLRVLVIDDHLELLNLIKAQLMIGGYDVLTADNGSDGVRLARTETPDLVICDVMMPDMDGFEVARRLRADRATWLLPIIMLTAGGTQVDKIRALREGIDDFINKPFAQNELEARIEGLIGRYRQSRASNPLTGLPGNTWIMQHVNERLERGEMVAVAYTDLDHFKAYNDKYGYEKGDDVIRLMARILGEVADQSGGASDFVGHIGGDDFIYVGTPETIEFIAQAVIERFDEQIRVMYDDDDSGRGYIEVLNRQGILQRFPLVSVSIGICTNERRTLRNALQVSEICTEVKGAAKQISGSSYVVDRRRDVPPARVAAS